LVVFFSRFLVLGQHVHAGVNEWLTIRNLDRDFFRWLRISRGEDRRSAVHKRQYRGGQDICHRCGFFAARGADQKKERCQEFPTVEKDLAFLQAAIHLSGSVPYTG
jgi:hypothetical protein